MSRNSEFEGKVAIVTGAAAGIGRACAIRYAEDQARVVVADMNESGGRETVEMIRASGGEAIFLPTDISSPSDCEQLVKQTLETYGRLDVACNNAGIAGEASGLADQSLDNWQKVIATNLTGVFLCMKYEIPAMLAGGGGSIVNLSSLLGVQSSPGISPYVAAKHGVLGLTRNAGAEYGAHGIRVNAVCPGLIDTAMTRKGFSDDVWQGMVKGIPLRRAGLPQEVAELVVWLSSGKASYVNGAGYLLDGGISIV